MIGGDLAARYPQRMVAGILKDEEKIDDFLISRAKYFPRRELEVEVILKQIRNSKLPVTTSCGRVLDAVAGLLGICYERSYEGEPAMKLESAAIGGTDVLNLTPKIKMRIADTTSLIVEVFNNLGSESITDLAYSAEAYIAKALALIAVDEARRISIDVVGFSGGVAYNEHITQTMREVVEENGLRFLVHDQVPPGDGGISLGQAIAVDSLLELRC